MKESEESGETAEQPSDDPDAVPTGPDYGAIAARVRSQVAARGLDQFASVIAREDGVSLLLENAILFPIGEATLLPAAQQSLAALVDVVLSFGRPVRIEGHTDNVPIATERFPSNWHLSAVRAANVALVFTGEGFQDRNVDIAAYGSTRPIAANDTPAGRQQNRRVEILVR